jgi:hypothetical protein
MTIVGQAGVGAKPVDAFNIEDALTHTSCGGASLDVRRAKRHNSRPGARIVVGNSSPVESLRALCRVERGAGRIEGAP